MISDRERLWLLLTQINNIGPVNACRLVDSFGSIEALFAASCCQLQEVGLNKEQRSAILCPDDGLLVRVTDWLEQSEDHHLLTPEHVLFPRLLQQVSGAPNVLYAKGQLHWLQSPQIAVVGSRHPSVAGKGLIRHFVSALVKEGFVITSGLALGIDGMAHEAALASGGATIAVTGTGLDRVYPAAHKSLAHRVAQSGLLVSEFMPGVGVKPSHFPQRNRIISGLSLGVLVVEAAIGSGSLITARTAIDQDREVFAIPGSIHNPVAKGCHALIKQGGHLVETVDDILEQLNWLACGQHDLISKSAPDMAQLSEEQQRILTLIDFAPTPLDNLVEACQKSVAELSSKLLTLELEGWVVSSVGGYQRLK